LKIDASCFVFAMLRGFVLRGIGKETMPFQIVRIQNLRNGAAGQALVENLSRGSGLAEPIPYLFMHTLLAGR
jgi:hypothetical protein